MTAINESLSAISKKVLNDRRATATLETIHSSVENAVALVNASHGGKNLINLDYHSILSTSPAPGLTPVLINLLNNSIEAGGERNRITLKAEVVSGEVKLVIQDRGGGIAREVLSKIRKGQSVTTKENGNGIGLRSAFEWAKQNGSKINVNSNSDKLNHGTEIEFRIPC